MDITAFTINLFPAWVLSMAAFFAAMGWVYWFLRGKTIVILRGFALAFALPLFYYALFDFLTGYSNMETIDLVAISRTARALYYTITIVFHILAFRWRHVTDDHR